MLLQVSFLVLSVQGAASYNTHTTDMLVHTHFPRKILLAVSFFSAKNFMDML